MNLVPVLERELRSQARRRGTYWLRVVGAGLLIAVFGLVMVPGREYPIATLGPILFGVSNGVVHYLIWLGVPLMVADAISREKREGTLGLLFLTPLTALDVVLGKALTLGWGGVGLLLAGFPVLALPFAMGGVSGQHALVMVAVHALSLLLALAAGLTASALSRRMARAVSLALLLSGLLSLLLNVGLVLVFGGRLESVWFGPAVLAQMLTAGSILPRVATGWLGLGAVIGVALAVAAGLLVRTVRQVQDFWQEAPVTTDRLRGAMKSWLRLLGVLGAALLLLGWGTVWLDGPQPAVRVGLAGTSVLTFVVLWVGIVARVLRDALLAERADPPDGPGGEHGREARGRGRGQRGRLTASARALGAFASKAGDRGPEPSGNRWIPWLTGAVLMGWLAAGVAGAAAWLAVITTVLNHVGSALLAFGVANLAWAWGRSWMRAVLRSLVIAVPVLVAWLTLQGLVVGHLAAESGLATSGEGPWRHGWGVLMLVGGIFGTGTFLWFGPEPIARLHQGFVIVDTLGVVLVSAVVSLGLWVIAGWIQTRRRRVPERDDPGANLARDFLEPLFARGWLRGRRRRVLERNPMRWVFERSRLVRLQRLGWLAVVAVVETIVAGDAGSLHRDELVLSQTGIVLGLLLGLSFAAVLSFQEEKRTGAIELILVTPMTPGQIIAGRWRGLIGQFLPAFGLVALVCGLVPLGMRLRTSDYLLTWLLFGLVVVGVAGAVCTVGMLCSLRVRNPAGGWLLTVLIPVLNLAAVWMLLLGGLRRYGPWTAAAPVAGLCLVNLVVGALALRGLVLTLRRRELRG